MIARVEFTYQGRTTLLDLAKSETVYEELRKIIFGAPGPEDKEKSWLWPGETIVELATDGKRLLDLGVGFEVKQIKGTTTLQAIAPDGVPHNVYVQVPHVGLLAVDEVQLEENCCTDRLQGLLDDGWRLICVCPPNAARRPDYILGRTKEKKG